MSREIRFNIQPQEQSYENTNQEDEWEEVTLQQYYTNKFMLDVLERTNVFTFKELQDFIQFIVLKLGDTKEMKTKRQMLHSVSILSCILEKMDEEDQVKIDYFSSSSLIK